MNYETAWNELKTWLGTQQGYIVIPVQMVRDYMSELEDMYGDW